MSTTLSTENRIRKMRLRLRRVAPFFGAPALRLKLVESPRCKTAATDGIHLLYAPAYIDKLTDDELVGLIAHEVGHIIRRHHLRQGSRPIKPWNYTCDGAIDHDLKDVGFTVPDSFADIPELAWMHGLTSEVIYDRMQKQREQQRQKKQQQQKGSGAGSGGDGDEAPDPDDSDDEPDDGDDNAAEPDDGAQRRPGKAKSKPQPSADSYDDLPDRGGQVLPYPGTPERGETEVRTMIAEAILMQERHNQQKGTTPGWFSAYVTAQREANIPWIEHLRRFIAPVYPTDTTWRRPARRHAHAGLYLPSTLRTGCGEGIIFLDTSGSMGGVLARALAEINRLFEDVRPVRVHLIQCDARVQDVHTYEEGEPLDTRIKGLGGSDFRPAFAALAEMDANPEWGIVLSDMQIDFPPGGPDFPVIAFSFTSTPGPDWAQNHKVIL